MTTSYIQDNVHKTRPLPWIPDLYTPLHTQRTGNSISLLEWLTIVILIVQFPITIVDLVVAKKPYLMSLALRNGGVQL